MMNANEVTVTRSVDSDGVVTLRPVGRTWFCEITPEGAHGFSVTAFNYGRELSRYSALRPYYKTLSGAERAARLWFAKRHESSCTTSPSATAHRVGADTIMMTYAEIAAASLEPRKP